MDQFVQSLQQGAQNMGNSIMNQPAFRSAGNAIKGMVPQANAASNLLGQKFFNTEPNDPATGVYKDSSGGGQGFFQTPSGQKYRVQFLGQPQSWDTGQQKQKIVIDPGWNVPGSKQTDLPKWSGAGGLPITQEIVDHLKSTPAYQQYGGGALDFSDPNRINLPYPGINPNAAANSWSQLPQNYQQPPSDYWKNYPRSEPGMTRF